MIVMNKLTKLLVCWNMKPETLNIKENLNNE